jgi:hypothetical protein
MLLGTENIPSASSSSVNIRLMFLTLAEISGSKKFNLEPTPKGFRMKIKIPATMLLRILHTAKKPTAITEINPPK